VTLTPEEIGPGFVVGAPGETVDVWLRFVEIRVQERAVVLASTDRAVQVEVTRRDGSSYRVWVWRRAESGERRAESGERRAESGERRAESGER